MRLKFLAALFVLASPVTATAGEVSFERDVLPVLTRAGCNAGACHGRICRTGSVVSEGAVPAQVAPPAG